VEKRRPRRRQPNDPYFGSLIMLAVTAGTFLLATWVAMTGLSSSPSTSCDYIERW
jgi:hypothetical protein